MFDFLESNIFFNFPRCPKLNSVRIHTSRQGSLLCKFYFHSILNGMYFKGFNGFFIKMKEIEDIYYFEFVENNDNFTSA